MDTKQLAADIEAKKLLVKSCKEQFRQAESDLALLETSLAEASLAEAEEPKLRHGDYGTATYKGKEITWYCDGSAGQDTLCLESYTYTVKHIRWFRLSSLENVRICGNVQDDLKAMAEDLGKCEIENGYYIPIRCDMTKHGKLIIRQDKNSDCKMDDCWVSVHKDHIGDFILNLRRMEATLRRKRLDK